MTMLDPRLAAMLPRFLRDAKLLDRLRRADEEYSKAGTTGPLVIEAHYMGGEAKKTKLKFEETHQ